MRLTHHILIAKALNDAADALDGGRRVKSGGRRVKSGGRRVKSGGRRVKSGGRRVKSGGRRVKAGGSPQVFVGLVVAPALGEWVEIEDDEDSMQAAIDAVVDKAREKEPHAEEYMFSDYDGLPNLGEHASVADLVKMAELLNAYEEIAVEAAYALVSDVDQAEELLDNGYGVYDSEEEYAEEMVDNMGGPGNLGEQTRARYIDFDKLGRDLSYDITMVRVGATPYFFNNV